MNNYLVNAVSLNMLPHENGSLAVRPLANAVEAKNLMNDYQGISSNFVNAIGHAETDTLVRAELDVRQVGKRLNIKLAAGDVCLVAQYSGPRLPEGATKLPDGAKIEYSLVEWVPAKK